jgi:exopolysaccharide biosynthesis polyprenyl glycosylphosphotransferase
LHVLLLAAFDLFALYEAFALAFAIRIASDKPLPYQMSKGEFGAIAAALSPYWVILFAAAGLYSVRRRSGRASELGRLTVVLSAGIMLLVVADYLRLFRGPIFPAHGVPVCALPIGVVFAFACRLVARGIMRDLQRRGYALRNVVLVGSGELAQRIAADLCDPANGCRIIGVVAAEHDGGVFMGSAPVFPNLDAAVARFGTAIDEIMQADVDLDRAEIARMMVLATSAGITYRFVPDQYGVYAAASSMTTVAGVPVMGVRLTALDGWAAIGKRAFDVAGAVVFLALFAPVMLLLAAAVKISDPAGPVLYRQTRVGRGNSSIRVVKFRSMRWLYSTGPDRPYKSPEEAFRAMGRADLCSEFERDQKVHDDPRITAIGRLLRRTSLDELPQLFDVLRGDLSLIGPRPITPGELARYGSQRASYLALKPGITGLWQVSGRSDVSYDERVKLDIFYVENWSMRLDLTILARTTTAVLAKKGAH